MEEVGKAEKKARAAIEPFLEDDETILAWTMGKTAPAEWMGFLPGFSMHYKLNTRGWVVVLTPYRVILLESKAMLSWQLTFAQDCELPQVREATFKSGVWTDRLTLGLGSKPVELKEVDAEDVQVFLKAYRDAKKALKLAQGR